MNSITDSFFSDRLDEYLLNALATEILEDLIGYEVLLRTLEYEAGITREWRGRTTLKDYSDEEIDDAMKYIKDMRELVDFKS